MYLSDTLYHVYNRGAHRSNIFDSEFQYNFCLQLFEKYKTKYGVNILAYCLMPNHYHLLLKQCEGGSISRFLQTTFNAYTQSFNQLENHSGTIFQGAAKGIQVDSDEYAVHLVGYIHCNPYVAGLAKTPEGWIFSDCQEWMGLRNFRYGDNGLMELYFKDGKDYKEFLDNYKEAKIVPQIQKYFLD
jgi:putative transposase